MDGNIRHPSRRILKLEELEQRLLLSGDLSTATVQVAYSLADLNGSNGFVLEGIGDWDRSGTSVSTAGDINGDGYADILIGAPDADPYGNTEGEAYVVFGKASGFAPTVNLDALNGNDGFTLEGIGLDDETGYSVSTAGDINGDGYADILIGAPGANDSAGAVYLIFGKNSNFSASLDLLELDGSNGFVVDAPDEDTWFGDSVSTAGDINGDGYSDILIGAPNADPGGVYNAGKAYLMFGKTGNFSANINLSSLDGTNGFVMHGIHSYARLGYSVSTAGDVNGDGYSDLLIGSPYTVAPNALENNGGDAYLVFGKSDNFSANINVSALDGTNGVRIVGNATGPEDGRFGFSVSTAGDVNGDGYADLLLGEPFGGQDPEEGRAYVVYGKATGFGSTSHYPYDGIFTGVLEADRAGWSVSTAGDVNRDGYTDILIGAPYRNSTDDELETDLQEAGETYLVFGKSEGFESSTQLASLDGTNGIVIKGVQPNDHSGWSVSMAGDINGDGYADVLIGAPDAGSGENDYWGETYVFFGRDFSVEPPETNQRDLAGLYRDGQWFMDLDDEGGVGESIAYYGIPTDIPVVGDWNGDGIDDLAIYRGGQWLFDNNNDGGLAESSFWFGLPGDIPVAGDFDGNGIDDAAVFRNGLWFIDLEGDGVLSEKSFWFGLPGDVPVTGDFDGNDVDDAVVYRNGQWFMDLEGDGGIGEKSFWFGLPGDVPVTGDWNKDGIDNAAVYRTGQWFFDFDDVGFVGEKTFWFGLPTDLPVAGRWHGSTSGNSERDNSDLFTSAILNLTEISENVTEEVEYTQTNRGDFLSFIPSTIDGMTLSSVENSFYYHEDDASTPIDDDAESDDNGHKDLPMVIIDLCKQFSRVAIALATSEMR